MIGTSASVRARNACTVRLAKRPMRNSTITASTESAPATVSVMAEETNRTGLPDCAVGAAGLSPRRVTAGLGRAAHTYGRASAEGGRRAIPKVKPASSTSGATTNAVLRPMRIGQ